jgi:hypothetical protein
MSRTHFALGLLAASLFLRTAPVMAVPSSNVTSLAKIATNPEMDSESWQQAVDKARERSL